MRDLCKYQQDGAGQHCAGFYKQTGSPGGIKGFGLNQREMTKIGFNEKDIMKNRFTLVRLTSGANRRGKENSGTQIHL